METSAAFSINWLTHRRQLTLTAQCNGVSPRKSIAFIFALTVIVSSGLNGSYITPAFNKIAILSSLALKAA